MMQPRQTCFWLLAAALCLPVDAFATDYFVRKTGNNGNAGTSAGTAWLTIDYAADSMSAGDTVYVGAGTYSERVTPSPSGTSGSPIRYIADTDGTQTGDAGDVLVTGSSGLQTLVLSNKDYLEFDGFKFKGFGDDAVRLYYADSIVLDNCEIYSGTQGINVTGGNNVTVRNCIIRDNSIDGINTASVTGMLVSRCEIYGNVMGIDVDSGGVTIRNCLIRDNSSRGIDLTVGTAVVQNCTIVSNTTDGIHQGSGVLTVTNCLIANNGDDGLDFDAGSRTHSYNLVWGNSGLDFEGTSASTGDISVDPQFISSTDYRARTLSPAINAGADLTGMVDDDIDGAARPYDGAWDIGCYEMAPDGHWKLDETSGATAVDSSGRGYDGDYNNTPILGGAGVLGNAAEFDGVNEHVEVASVSSLDNPKAITVACWAKSDTATWNNWGMLVSKRSQFVMSPTNGTAVLSWYVYDDVGSAHVMAFGLDSLSGFDLRDWHHYACSYDPVAGIMAMYVDGVLINSSSQSFTLNSDTGSLFIGLDDGLARYFDGMMDDVRVYTYALNAAEITALNITGSTETLVGHWKLDETSGTVAVDSSTYGNDGTYTNSPTLGGTGVFENAVNFDGTDDHVEVTAPQLDNPAAITVACWAKSDMATWNESGVLVSKRDQFILYPEAGGTHFRWYVYENGATWRSTSYTLSTIPGFNLRSWHHYVGTYDPAAGVSKLYIDGVHVASSNISFPINTDTGPLMIGKDDYWESRHFDGKMDDVRIYNRALVATEIAELYGLTGHWKMDEGSGATAADSTAFANHATLYGATWTTDCAGNSGLEFDGISDTASTNASFDPPERGAVAMWFRSDGPPAARQRPWGVGSDFEMWQDPDGFVSCDVSTDGFQGGFITTDPLHMDGRWYHMIAEYDSDDDSYAIYINGELHKSGISTWAMTKQAANTLTFGTRTGITEYFEGGIRDFRIYNRPLTASEKSELSGLAGYWKLNESSGTVAVDSSANGNVGTYTGGVLLNQTGTIDEAADFDGADDYVTVPDDSTLQMDNVFSISGWIRPDTSSNVDQMVLNKEGEYEIALSPSDELKWGITNTDPGWSWHGTGHIVAIGKWTHIALTYDNGTVNTYANGILVDTYNGSGSIGDQYTLLNELRIGGRSNNPSGKYFDGLIDDIRLFKRALCPIEIYGQYKTGRPAGIRILKWVEVR